MRSDFQRFIRDNNNVTWRNFNVVDNLPDTEVDPLPNLKLKALDFLSPGAPRQAVPMQLEIVGKLPLSCAALYGPHVSRYSGLTDSPFTQDIE